VVNGRLHTRRVSNGHEPNAPWPSPVASGENMNGEAFAFRPCLMTVSRCIFPEAPVVCSRNIIRFAEPKPLHHREQPHAPSQRSCKVVTILLYTNPNLVGSCIASTARLAMTHVNQCGPPTTLGSAELGVVHSYSDSVPSPVRREFENRFFRTGRRTLCALVATQS
jgi:hypothetical protein